MQPSMVARPLTLRATVRRMVTRASTPPVPAKLYRHFAVVTLVITVGMAMFADGENREAVAREAYKASSPSQQGDPNQFIRKDNKQHGSFGTDEWAGDNLEPMGTSGASLSGGALSGPSADGPSGMPVGYSVYDMPKSEWAALSDEQRKKIIAAREAAEAAAGDARRAEEKEAILAASRARSGTRSGSED
jgi:hypothetical protein